MIISPSSRLILLVLAGITPVWERFFNNSTDYSLRGLAIPILGSISVAVVIVIARTRNPLVDGEPPKVEIVNTPKNPVPTEETNGSAII